MKKTLGGSMFIHNAVEFDYCVAEALTSLCEICDEVVIIDTQSTDGTLDVIKEVAKKYNHLRIFEGVRWTCLPNFKRLVLLADMARSLLNTDWHFMLQADEVIHESSFPFIREAICDPKYHSYMTRRMNLFGDLNHYLRYDIPQEHKPCNDQVIRLATINNPATGDAEYLQVDPKKISHKFLDDILIFHYGFVRRDKNMIEKCINMQSWFFGENSIPDSRIVEMKNKDQKWDWTVMKTPDLLVKRTIDHPIFAKEWAETRQLEKSPL